ncbi:TniQ family protein [Paenibacillus roseipurpureus]|uniref:TniQ family protein n=1 Tax=Paenibacillus roseopurpureus TaxID=2918901 RepID=A0AA96RIN9_9BACL|nr:TniQ family protein [Paenibacillus sp. MBLB1832]WNR43010.1 TniQ family protein [Paenibacillus sp. MBLB1832]
MNKFLNIPCPIIDETLGSYLSRLLKSNYYQSKAVIKKMSCNFENKLLLNQKKSIDLSHRVSKEYIAKLYHNQKIMNICMNNPFVSKYGFLKDSIRICPKCLEDNPFHRNVWRFVGYTICQEHNSYMLSHCTCGREIRSLSTDLLFCDCGKDYRSINAVKRVQHKNNHNYFIYSKIMNNNLSNEPESNFLSSLEVQDSIEILLRLSKYLLYRGKVRTSCWAFLQDIILMDSLMNESWSYFLDWPIKFNCLMVNLDDGLFNNKLISLKNELNRDPYIILTQEVLNFLNLKTKHVEPILNGLEKEITSFLTKSMNAVGDKFGFKIGLHE